MLANANQLVPGFWPGGVPRVGRHFRPSLAYRLCLVAEGHFDAMFTFRDTWEWDVAAGDLIAREAGALVTDRHGAALRYNAAQPLVPGLVVAGPATARGDPRPALSRVGGVGGGRRSIAFSQVRH